MNHSKYRARMILLSLVLLSPSLTMGFYADDYALLLTLSGQQPGSPMRPWSLFDFGRFDDWDVRRMQVATFPWWTSHDWQIRFWRPISSIALWIQQLAFGNWAAGYHVTSLVLFAILMWNVHGLYRSLGLTSGAVARGTLLFGVGDAIVLPTIWIANQNTLWETLLAVLSWRLLVAEPLSVRRVLGALILSTGAVLSKESGCASLVIAYVVLARRSQIDTLPASRRVARIGSIGSLLILLSWGIYLFVAGYGTRSLFYATPWSDTWRFAHNALCLFTAGVASLGGPFPLDLAGIYAWAYMPLVVMGILVGGPFATWVFRRTVRLPGTGWLCLWTILQLGFQSAAPPSDRLLLAPSVGAAGILGAFFDAEKQRARQSLQSRWSRSVLVGWWLWATVVSAVFIGGEAAVFSVSANYLRERARETTVGPSRLGYRHLLVMQCESQLQAFTLPATYAGECDDHELTFWNLQHGRRALRWTCVDARTFELETLDEPFLTQAFEQVYMTQPLAIRRGDRWKTPLFAVSALETDRGRPTKLRFRLNRSLDDPRIIFLRSEHGKLAAIAPPPIGTAIVLEPPERAGPWMP
jgi:hypothetical protein